VLVEPPEAGEQALERHVGRTSHSELHVSECAMRGRSFPSGKCRIW
jgi:hypothetical protein